MTLHVPKTFPLLTLTTLAFGLAACSKPAAPVKPPVAVTMGVAEKGEAPYVVAANGVVEPMQSVAVQSQVGGVLQQVHFKEGDEVTQGQVLFSIDARPYAAALAAGAAPCWRATWRRPRMRSAMRSAMRRWWRRTT